MPKGKRDPETSALNKKIRLIKIANNFALEAMKQLAKKNKGAAEVYGAAEESIREIIKLESEVVEE